MVLETQQSSDTTYRVYDFDRKDDQGNLNVDGQDCYIAKGGHFILPSDIQAWEIEGNLELIVSHP